MLMRTAMIVVATPTLVAASRSFGVSLKGVHLHCQREAVVFTRECASDETPCTPTRWSMCGDGEFDARYCSATMAVRCSEMEGPACGRAPCVSFCRTRERVTCGVRRPSPTVQMYSTVSHRRRPARRRLVIIILSFQYKMHRVRSSLSPTHRCKPLG